MQYRRKRGKVLAIGPVPQEENRIFVEILIESFGSISDMHSTYISEKKILVPKDAITALIEGMYLNFKCFASVSVWVCSFQIKCVVFVYGAWAQIFFFLSQHVLFSTKKSKKKNQNVNKQINKKNTKKKKIIITKTNLKNQWNNNGWYAFNILLDVCLYVYFYVLCCNNMNDGIFLNLNEINRWLKCEQTHTHKQNKKRK